MIDAGTDAETRVAAAPLRIALLTHSVNPRGGVVHTLELANALHDAGHRVTVFAPALPGQAMFRPVRCGLELVPVPPAAASVVDAEPQVRPDAARGDAGVVAMVRARIAAFERHLEATVPRQRFDVLHAQDPIGANALANLQDRGLVDGFVRTVHHLDDFVDVRLAAWQRRGVERAAQVLCVSRQGREVLQRQFGVVAQQVDNGVDLARHSPARAPRADGVDARIAARHGFAAPPRATRAHAAAGLVHGADDAPVVLAVGGIEARKNTHRLVEAFALLHAERPGARLVIAGGASLLDHDAYAAGFHARVRAAGLRIGAREAVVVTGTVADDEMPALYRAASVLAMPSLHEGFGLAVLEALACGTPVVASNIAPFTEHLNQHGERDAVLADPHHAADIARALREALATRDAAAWRLPPVCRRFGWPQSAARHAALYRAARAVPGAVSRRTSSPDRHSVRKEFPTMPAMHFHLRWPDGSEQRCYSPSLVIREHVAPGASYPLPRFMDSMREALNVASERVRAKYGFACSMAMDTLAQLEQQAARFDGDARAQVVVTAFEP